MGSIRSELGRFLKAAVLGSSAAIACAVVYAAMPRSSLYLALLAPSLFGLAIGWVIRAVSGGGRPYQVLALGLTYATIVASLVPEVVEELDAKIRTEALATAESADTPGPDEGPAPLATDREGLPLRPNKLALAITILVAAGPWLPIEAASNAPLLGFIYVFAIWEAWWLNRKRGDRSDGASVADLPRAEDDPSGASAQALKPGSPTPGTEPGDRR